MKAIIVATNKIELQGETVPIALINICGLTLLERSLYSLKKGGVDDFTVVTGYKSELIEGFIQEKKLDYKFNLKMIHDKKYDNGSTSFSVVSKNYNGKGVLTTSVDTLFNLSIIKDKIASYEDLEKHFLFQIKDEGDIKKSEGILLVHAHTIDAHKDDLITFYIHENIAKFLSQFLVRRNITPNEITWTSFLFEVMAAYFFFLGGHRYFVIGAIFLNFFWIFDHVDGAIARLKFMFSMHGFWLDAILGFVGQNLWIIGATFGMYNQMQNNLAWIVGLIMISTIYLRFMRARFNRSALYGDAKVIHKGIPMDTKRTSGRLIGRIRSYINRARLYLGTGSIIFIITLGAIFDQMILAFLSIIVIANLQFVIGFFLMNRYLREISESQ